MKNWDTNIMVKLVGTQMKHDVYQCPFNMLLLKISNTNVSEL